MGDTRWMNKYTLTVTVVALVAMMLMHGDEPTLLLLIYAVLMHIEQLGKMK